MILSCQNICKAFGENVILNNASFHIEEREKAALIGYWWLRQIGEIKGGHRYF